jgi:hypothetical protein
MKMTWNLFWTAVAAAMCLAGAANVGTTGYFLAIPWGFVLASKLRAGWRAHGWSAALLACVCVALRLAQPVFPAAYFTVIGQTVSVAKPAAIDESNYLACNDPMSGRADAGRENISGRSGKSIVVPAGVYEIVDVDVHGGIDSPIESEFVVSTPQGRFVASVPVERPGFRFNYSCLSDYPKNEGSMIRAWSLWLSSLVNASVALLVVFGAGSALRSGKAAPKKRVGA